MSPFNESLVYAIIVVMKYDFAKVENKWKEKWSSMGLYKAVDSDSREKKYVLVEFPYPSGSGLHVGHSFSFTGGDVYARYLRMRGYNVLFPMGWDAFGLPTENYAIKMKRKPQEVTKENTEVFKRQMDDLGFSFDWDRVVDTTDPEYYKWTQWIFIKLFEKGLAYKEERPINWCPSCKIGLANEEVVDGKCERCGTETERRNITQWIVKITEYADRLIDGLKDTAFIEKVKAAQINWIDRKEWLDITYPIDGLNESVTVSTTRPDTNFGATFVTLAPEHELVGKIMSGEIKIEEDISKISEYVKKALAKSELERKQEVAVGKKTGVFTGLYALNPLNNSKLPIWVADFVLGTVGTGAVVGVPAHDIRDFEFAWQFQLPIARVVKKENGDDGDVKSVKDVLTEDGIVINSDFLNGLSTQEAKEEISEYIIEKGFGKKSVRHHLRDWIFSRQHYWGEPIPMINCERCGWVPVPVEQLPIVLPEVEHYEPTDTGESPLALIEDWVNTTCPKCGGPAKRETDTMPNWAGSDWYFIRYTDPRNSEELADMQNMKYWLPVDVYMGGDEHNTLHLLYSRFIYQFLYDLGVVPTPEPYHQRISHGVILGVDGKRMSKSRGNVIIPDDIVQKVGADATRMYHMFMGPFDSTMAWNDNALFGVKRFVDRVYNFVNSGVGMWGEDSDEIARKLNSTIKFATDGLEKFQYNTVVAKYMELLNLMEKSGHNSVSKQTVDSFMKILAPFAPFLTEQLWEELGNEGSVHEAGWVEFDEGALHLESVEIPVQINGKVRERVQISVNLSESEIRDLVLNNERIKEFVGSSEIRKFIYVPGRAVNIVV